MKLKFKEDNYHPKGKQNYYIRYKVNSEQLICEQYSHRHNNVNTKNELSQRCDRITTGGWLQVKGVCCREWYEKAKSYPL